MGDLFFHRKEGYITLMKWGNQVNMKTAISDSWQHKFVTRSGALATIDSYNILQVQRLCIYSI